MFCRFMDLSEVVVTFRESTHGNDRRKRTHHCSFGAFDTNSMPVVPCLKVSTMMLYGAEVCWRLLRFTSPLGF